MRGETQDHVVDLAKMVFQSTLPMRGETTGRGLKRRSPAISIHSPHAGRDFLDGILGKYAKDFNPLSPCGERPIPEHAANRYRCISIHSPHAGRDFRSSAWRLTMTYFNPLSPCGERLLVFITIRMRSLFQSTLPMRGETGWIKHIRHSKEISIHSPHAGRDVLPDQFLCVHRISIHSPHAGRD